MFDYERLSSYLASLPGPSILGGASTTIVGTAFLLPCRILLFQKLGLGRTWRFPKMGGTGVPQIIPELDYFSIETHGFGDPGFQETPTWACLKTGCTRIFWPFEPGK